MNFLHILANLDVYHAYLCYGEPKRPNSKAHRPMVRFTPDTIPPSRTPTPPVDNSASTPQPTEGLRPTSVVSAQEGILSSGHREGRPKSGKSLTFQLSPGRHTPALSVSTAEFRFIHSRDLKTPVSSTKVAHFHSNDIPSGRSIQLSSVREGARSPTPNAVKDMEPAFLDLSLEEAGVTVWRVQGKKLRACDTDEHGFFHEGNAYIVLNVINSSERSLHYWFGSHSNEKEKKLAEEKAHQLDQIVATGQLFSREVQNHESTVFRRVFADGIIYIEGQHKQNVVKASHYERRLYVVSDRKYPRAACVMPSRDHIKSSNVVILDGYPRMYVWIGKDSPYVLRHKAMQLARKIQLRQRKGICHIVVVDENDASLSETFRRKFDDTSYPVVKPSNRDTCQQTSLSSTTENEQCLVLHRISGDRVLYDMPEAHLPPLKQCYLVRRDCFLVDQGPESTLYMWVGTNAMEAEVNHAITRAQTFREHKGYPATGAICRVRENHEPSDLKRCFCDWRDRPTREASITKRYSAGNIGRALFSRTDRRTVATMQECWSEDTVGEHRRNTQVWLLADDTLETWEHVGVFTNNRCFLLLHTTIEGAHYQYIIYYWLGGKSTATDHERIVHFAMQKNKELDNVAVVIRVLDGKEPQHFMTSLSDWMLVYDGELSQDVGADRKLFCVRDAGDRATRVQQVTLDWSSLNSSASFVLLTPEAAFLWFGKLSGSTEREAAKDLLGVLCTTKMYSYEVVPEGKEPQSFLQYIDGKRNYNNEYKIKVLERRPATLSYFDPVTQTFELVDQFLQEDLSEEEILLLDTYDQVFVWCGERVQDRQHLSDVAKLYMSCDPSCREFESVSVWMISQRSEPVAFSKHFRSWNALGYSGRHSYEVMRKRIRQENAKIDIEQNLVDTTFITQPKYPYVTLLKAELPEDVDDTNKHNHLTERQFQANLNISRLEFYRLPLWKQRQILRSARLLYTPPLIRRSEE
ncbi:advillin-like isoform X2 [Dreissena polymorpha]|nr:advillin-like isoform X2 [Dreissena polymorpha]